MDWVRVAARFFSRVSSALTSLASAARTAAPASETTAAPRHGEDFSPLISRINADGESLYPRPAARICDIRGAGSAGKQPRLHPAGSPPEAPRAQRKSGAAATANHDRQGQRGKERPGVQRCPFRVFRVFRGSSCASLRLNQPPREMGTPGEGTRPTRGWFCGRWAASLKST